MCVADYITEDGQKTVDEFKKQFGDESAIFVKCDVRSLRDVQGNVRYCSWLVKSQKVAKPALRIRIAKVGMGDT